MTRREALPVNKWQFSGSIPTSQTAIRRKSSSTGSTRLSANNMANADNTTANTSQPTASPIDNTKPSTSSSETANNNATELIALLDQYVSLKGHTMTTHPPHPELTLPPLPTDHTPIALQMYPPTSLASHLRAHDLEQKTLASLTTRITTLSADPLTLENAHSYLEREFTHLQRPAAEQEAFKFLPLPQKLTHLRRQQILAIQPPHPPEFRSMLVVGINAAGLPDPVVGVYLPVPADWEEYEKALGDVMGSCSEEGEGKGGKGWVYQNIDKKGRVEREVRSLRGEEGYAAMRRELREGGGVLVWRERLWQASQEAKQREKEASRWRRGDDELGDDELGDVDFEDLLLAVDGDGERVV